MSTTTSDGTQDLRHPFFARLYHHVLQREPSERDVRCRQRLLAGIAGTVVEVGPGNGPNFAHYPPTVERVVAVEPESFLRGKATEAASRAPVPIDVTAGDADHLPLADGEADAVVLALCSVPDQMSALAEARRVLRPGGELRVYEHVVAEHPVARTAQRAAQATFWPRAFGNCHPARDTLAALGAAGLDTTAITRFVMQTKPMEPPMPFILGIATTG